MIYVHQKKCITDNLLLENPREPDFAIRPICDPTTPTTPLQLVSQFRECWDAIKYSQGCSCYRSQLCHKVCNSVILRRHVEWTWKGTTFKIVKWLKESHFLSGLWEWALGICKFPQVLLIFFCCLGTKRVLLLWQTVVWCYDLFKKSEVFSRVSKWGALRKNMWESVMAFIRLLVLFHINLGAFFRGCFRCECHLGFLWDFALHLFLPCMRIWVFFSFYVAFPLFSTQLFSLAVGLGLVRFVL